MKKELIEIAKEAIKESLPDAAVKRALADIGPCEGKTVIVSVGKAGWQMAKAAAECLDGRYDEGYVITKYDHSKGEIDKFTIYEAGHPVLDENSVSSTGAVIKAVENLTGKDRVLFLLSGGGSALFESPAISLEEFTRINKELLACGADIVEMNTIRKRISKVKGGRFAKIQGRTIREDMCSGACLFHHSLGYRRGSSGYDRIRPGISRQLHIGGCTQYSKKV